MVFVIMFFLLMVLSKLGSGDIFVVSVCVWIMLKLLGLFLNVIKSGLLLERFLWI